MNILYFFLIGITIFSFIQSAQAQTVINVTDAEPCFLNYTAGVQMWENCGFREDFMRAAIAPFEWVTGGMFSMIIVIVIIIGTYLKYHTIIYPIAIGIVMLPISWFLFPTSFISFAILMAGIGIAAVIWSIVVQRTNSN